MEMEGMIANAPGHRTLLVGGSTLVCLTFDAQIHNVISTDGAVIDDNVPGPKGNTVPLLNLKSFLAITHSF